jgi:hypothetical protein
MSRRALEGYEKVLGAEHPDTLTSLNCLASVRRDQGKYETSEEEKNQRALKTMIEEPLLEMREGRSETLRS